MSLEIRLATDADMDYMLIQAEEFIEYHPLNLSYDESHMKNVLSALMEKGAIYLAIKDEQPIGGIGGMPVPCFFDTNYITLAELFLWIDKDHRTGSAMLRLIKVFEESASRLGANSVALCHTELTPGLGKIYGRYGYSLMEHTYSKEA